MFYSAATISGVFSGLIAYGIQEHLYSKTGRPTWEYLFIIEGSAGLGIGILMWLMLPPFPDQMTKNWLFKKEEVKLAVDRSRGTTFGLSPA
jgi:MFS family permease